MKEETQTSKGVEYPTISVREVGDHPMLQIFDYGLRRDEQDHKGKLVGKELELYVENVRSIFAGRPQINGKILAVHPVGKA